MKYLLLFLGIVSGLYGLPEINQKGFVSKETQAARRQKLNYDSAILTIRKEVVDLTSASAVFSVKEFITIYENPLLYKNDALLFLSGDGYSPEEKIISIYTMQRLDLANYIAFFKSVVALSKEGKVCEEILSQALSCPVNKLYPLIKNYDNREIAKILNELKTDEKISCELKERIGNILSGKAWKGLKHNL